ncbi:MAG TPA: hypothetical protein VL475_06845 [Planctomycetaceae bacterium]|nr:hypothetical protein [Planctomycetaceae bacterium]
MLILSTASAHSAERFELAEKGDDNRIFKVAVALDVSGTVYPEAGADKGLKLAVDGKFAYDERRQAGTGRDAQTLRSVRYYHEAEATIHEQSLAAKATAEQLSSFLLRDPLRLIVAGGQADGVELFSPSGPLTVQELQLLKYPGDSLALLGLLPDSKVEVTESWQPAEWVLPMLAGIEAAEKSKLTCRLESAEKGAAVISVSGEITGLALGVPAHVQITGRLIYDLELRCLRQAELTQTEKRSIGTVSPGLDVSAKVTVTRAVNEQPRRLTDKDLAGIPLEPNDASLLLMFEAPVWNLRFFHDRQWHLRYQTTEMAVLKLLKDGRPTAQCHIKKLPDAEPGGHVTEEQFQEDVRRTLGKDFQEFVEAEKLKLRDGLFVFRVVAVGSVQARNEKKEPTLIPMQWIYYLVANPEGRQVSFAFAVEPKLAEDLKSRDLSIVGGMEFLSRGPRVTPAKAVGK